MMRILSLKLWMKLLLGFLFFLVIVLFAAPRIARSYIVRHSAELIGRKLEIGKIRINYLTGLVRIDSLVLFEKDPASVFLSFRELRVNLQYLPLIRREINVSEISLENPYVQVLQDGSRFNFSDLAETDSTGTAETDTAPGPPVKYVLNHIRIIRGYVTYTDIPLGNTIALTNLDLAIPGFTWNSDSTRLAVDFRFVSGGGLYADLNVNQTDSSYAVKLKLDSLNLDIIRPYLENSLNISGIGGYLSNDLQVNGSLQHVTRLSVSGVNHVTDFRLTDTLNRDILTWKELTVDVNSFALEENKIDLNLIELTDPFILVETVDSTINWARLMKTTGQAPADTIPPTADTVPEIDSGSFRFSRLLLTGGTVRYDDRTLRYPFSYTVEKIRLDATPVAGSPGRLKMNLAATLNQTGNLATDLVLDPADLREMDLNLSIRQFRMKDADAYFRHYFGFPVAGGMLNFSTENRLKPGLLISNNQVYFRKFSLDERLKEEPVYRVPLRLALAVLSDRDGIIDLKAPVETRGSDVKVGNLRKIIFRIIGNLFLKAATSPYEALSGLKKVDPSDLKEVSLVLSDPSPGRKSMETLDVISDILVQRPGLKADFYYAANKPGVRDTLAGLLARRSFESYLRSKGMERYRGQDSTFRNYLMENLTEAEGRDTMDLVGLCRVFAGEGRIRENADSIREVQAGFLRNYLAVDKQLPPGQFSVTETPVDTIRPGSGLVSFRVYFEAAGDSAQIK